MLKTRCWLAHSEAILVTLSEIIAAQSGCKDSTIGRYASSTSVPALYELYTGSQRKHSRRYSGRAHMAWMPSDRCLERDDLSACKHRTATFGSTVQPTMAVSACVAESWQKVSEFAVHGCDQGFGAKFLGI